MAGYSACLTSFTSSIRFSLHAYLAAGSAPAEVKKAEKLAQKLNIENTFEAVAREWHHSKADRWSLRYRDEIIDTFEKDIFPTLVSALLLKANQWNYWKHSVAWKSAGR